MHDRSLLDNIADIEHVMVTAFMAGCLEAGVALFDISSAFPSAAWAWILETLKASVVLAWLISLVFGLLRGSTAIVVFLGAEGSECFEIVRGIKQGCPPGGALWAILFDPIVRHTHRLDLRFRHKVCLMRTTSPRPSGL